jgi:hypothetical protein
MNRKERRRYVAQLLRMLARSGTQVSEVGPPRDGWTCRCLGCELLRAGACMPCASLIAADAIERGKPGKASRTKAVHAACREAAERVLEVTR